MGTERLYEAALRGPTRRAVFFALLAFQFFLVALAITLVFYEPSWFKSHPLLDKYVGFLRILAVTALIGIPLLVLNRNPREAAIRGSSVRLSERQFPELYAELLKHCARLGMQRPPELFLTA